MTLALGLIAFAGGAWLLVEAVEGLVDRVRDWALAAGFSGVAVSALVLGLDVESTAAGVAATLDDLPGTALGTSVGASILLLTLGLGLAALLAPFTVRTPPAILAATALAAGLCAGLAFDGELSRIDGAILVAAFPPLVYVVFRSRRSGEEPPVSTRRPPGLVPRLLLALAGVVAGAELLVFGTERIVGELAIDETAFGLLVVAAAVCFEELVLELLPAHRGFPELSVGNALGTTVFLLTASTGIVALARPVEVPDAVVARHLPALLAASVLALALLARGRLGRVEGGLLVAAYVAYVTATLA